MRGRFYDLPRYFYQRPSQIRQATTVVCFDHPCSEQRSSCRSSHFIPVFE